MKHRITLFLLLTLLFFNSCHWKTNEALLLEIEEVMRTDIEQAAVMLSDIRVNRLSERELADFHRMKALYHRLSMRWSEADSLNTIALNFYRQVNDTVNLRNTLLQSGLIYIFKNQPNRAIDRFSELERMAYLENDFGSQGRFNFMIARRYFAKNEHDTALKYARRAIANVSNRDDLQTQLAYYYRETGRMHARLNAVDSALAYYQKALGVWLQREHPTNHISRILNDISQLHLSNEAYQQALEYAEKSIRYRANRQDAAFFNLTKARVLMALNKPDSAKLYLNRIIHTPVNRYLTIAAYRYLVEIFNVGGNYQRAFYTTLNQRELFDGSESAIRTNFLRQQFIEMQLENENNMLKLAKRNREFALLSAVFAIVMLAVVFLFFVLRAKKKEKVRLLLQREQELKNQATIAEQENRLLKQENELMLLYEKAATLRESLFRRLTVSEKIPSLDVANIQEKKEKYTKIALETSDWKELVETVDVVFNGFSSRLSRAYPGLSPDDIQFCCLLKINVSMQDLADIYCISKAGITKRKMRLKREKFRIEDSGLDLNEFLMVF